MEKLDELIDFLGGTTYELSEAIAVFKITLDELTVEDELLSAGIECCTGCYRWVRSTDIVPEDGDETTCTYCSPDE